LVCLALADGDDLPGSTATPGHGNAKAVVGASNPKDHTGAVGVVLDRYPVRPPANDAKRAGCPAGGVVPQVPPDLLSDALALVRKELWAHATFCESPADTDTVKVPRQFVEHLTETLCYAA
jgi:hypothetical protein